MAHLRNDKIKLVTALLYLTLQVTASAKTNARPVYEVINEQSKADEKLIKTSAIASLPYGNPLAGNSQQNARLHAHNQQAMFNAERVRQHKAQLQRWTKTPQLVNSYMRAYHESQESHQLALEQQQAKQDENKPKKSQRVREPLKTSKSQSDETKSKSEIMKPERRRNHRSYGSVEYQTVYLPSTTYSDSFKPITINEMANSPTAKHYTDFTPSTEHVYTKYYPGKDYQSIQDIETLNSLLNKNPGQQLAEFNALLNSARLNTVNHDKELEAPLDLYFYLKGPSKLPSPEHYDYTRFAQIPSTQELDTKDYAPSKEEVRNVGETQILEEPRQSDTNKNIQYINSELTNQILSTGYNPMYQEEHYNLKEEEKPVYQAFQYGHQPTALYIQNENDSGGDQSERYLHHNAHKGVQHLTEDGSGVPAYDNENLHYAASYEFGYRVRDHHSGNDFGHQEEKTGEATNGHYHVLLPDGRMQNVRYSAGPEGFHADISYDHE